MRTFAREFTARPTQNAWNEAALLQARMEKVFQGSNDSYGSNYPRLDVTSAEDVTVVRAEIPGVAAEEIDLSIDDDVLTLSGARQADELPEGTTWRHQERGYGVFKRRVRLPFRVESGSVDAQYNNGVLQVTLPRAEADKPQKISISAA
jgi:HSP20 family protein